jgi:hypothetical protein
MLQTASGSLARLMYGHRHTTHMRPFIEEAIISGFILLVHVGANAASSVSVRSKARPLRYNDFRLPAAARLTSHV